MGPLIAFDYSATGGAVHVKRIDLHVQPGTG